MFCVFFLQQRLDFQVWVVSRTLYALYVTTKAQMNDELQYSSWSLILFSRKRGKHVFIFIWYKIIPQSVLSAFHFLFLLTNIKNEYVQVFKNVSFMYVKYVKKIYLVIYPSSHWPHFSVPPRVWLWLYQKILFNTKYRNSDF